MMSSASTVSPATAARCPFTGRLAAVATMVTGTIMLVTNRYSDTAGKRCVGTSTSLPRSFSHSASHFHSSTRSASISSRCHVWSPQRFPCTHPRPSADAIPLPVHRIQAESLSREDTEAVSLVRIPDPHPASSSHAKTPQRTPRFPLRALIHEPCMIRLKAIPFPRTFRIQGESLSREDTEADLPVPIPGPHPWDIVGNVRDLSAIALRGIEEATLLYGRKYGPICRFANGVSAWTFVNDADIIAHICSTNSKNYSRRFLPVTACFSNQCTPFCRLPVLPSPLPPSLSHGVRLPSPQAVYEYVTHGKGILGSQGEYNRAHRRMCQPPFMRPNLLDAFSDTIQSQLDKLITMWRHQATTDDGSPLPNVVLDGNLAVQIQRFTLDIIGAVAFSKDFGQLDRIRADPAGSATEADAGADELLGAVNESQQLMANVFITPLPVLQLLRKLGEPGMLRLDAAMKAMEKVMMGVIEERREQWRATGDAGDDLLGVLLGATDERGRPLQDEELWEDVHDVMGAGHETTATTITAALFLISQHPEAKAKVHEELRALNGRMPSFQDVNSGRLAYTQMAVKETLRMYPPIPLFPREVAHTDRLPGGYELPGGDVVFMSTYAMGRNPVYWPEPLSFRPERFTPEAEAARPRFAWVPFGAGPRMCLGANFAVLAVTQVVATLLQNVVSRTRVRADLSKPLPESRDISEDHRGFCSLRNQSTGTEAHCGSRFDIVARMYSRNAGSAESVPNAEVEPGGESGVSSSGNHTRERCSESASGEIPAAIAVGGGPWGAVGDTGGMGSGGGAGGRGTSPAVTAGLGGTQAMPPHLDLRGAAIQTFPRDAAGAQTTIVLPNQRSDVLHFALDIGVDRRASFSGGGGSFRSGGGGRLHFVKFETSRIGECIEFIKSKRLHSFDILGMGGDEESLWGYGASSPRIKATGGGAFKYADLFKEKLGVVLDKEDEMRCLVLGLNFLLRSIRDEAFTHLEGEKQFVEMHSENIFPYLLVNIGSGVSILKVCKQLFPCYHVTLGSVFTMPCETILPYLLLIIICSSVRFLKVPHSDSQTLHCKIGLSAATIASSFGRVVGEQKQLFDYRPEDIALSLLRMVSYNIGQIAYLNALRYNLKRIFFGGFFIRGHAYTMDTISFAIKFWAAPVLKVAPCATTSSASSLAGSSSAAAGMRIRWIPSPSPSSSGSASSLAGSSSAGMRIRWTPSPLPSSSGGCSVLGGGGAFSEELSKGEMEATFLRHEGYLGALGAFLAHEEDAHAEGRALSLTPGITSLSSLTPSQLVERFPMGAPFSKGEIRGPVIRGLKEKVSWVEKFVQVGMGQARGE
ncbi:unnamed protein product [Closterium sp. Yama58-4]|nr:unnamed protein product [Closterium sp. Yama58-4]